jgi:16S rRNA (guanine527-N7)-methyltransferase
MRQLLASGATELGIDLSDRRLDAFDAFTALMLEWNTRLNLTRITDPEEIAVKHYLDSLVLLAKVEVPEGSSVIDIGTGAGFPGIPLKIARPDLRLTLLDSVRKRLTFLEAAVRELSLSDVEIVHSRAEDAARDKRLRDRFDFATARAVAGLNVLAELCIPFCRIGGRFAAYKGPEIGVEVEEASRAIELLGGRLEAVHEFDLPPGGIRRSLVIISKVKATPAGYPRKAGIPERNPL